MRFGDWSVGEAADRLAREGVCLRIGPIVTQLKVLVPGIAEHVRYLYHDTPVEPPGYVDFQVKLEPLAGLRYWYEPRATLSIDGEQKFSPFDPAVSMPMLEWCLNGCVFNRPNNYLILHSAVIERDGRAVIMPGPPGAGKSTLCSALAHRGWRLLSDEVALIELDSLKIHAVPRPVGLKEQSIEIMKKFEPNAKIGIAWPGTHKGTVAHMRVPKESVDRAEETALPGWIICPRYRADSEARLTPISKADTLLYVAQEAFNYSLLGESGFQTLASVVEQSVCHNFEYSNLDDAVRIFDQLAQEGPDEKRLSA